MSKFTIFLSTILIGMLAVLGMFIASIYYKPDAQVEPVYSEKPIEIRWDDLIPEGVPYADVIGLGEQDNERDIWKPAYDQNAMRLNNDLEGKLIQLPGFIVPLDTRPNGTKSFLLVPYAGACVHTPPPPANQIVVVESEKEWESESLYIPVIVTGTLTTNLQETDLAFVGYEMEALFIEKFDIEMPQLE